MATQREVRVARTIELLIDGASSTEIARELGVSLRTVDRYTRDPSVQLAVRRRRQDAEAHDAPERTSVTLTSRETGRLDVLGAVPLLFPKMEAPTWMHLLIDVLNRAFAAACGLGPPVFALVSYPPQTGKTSSIQAGIAEWLFARPEDSILYGSYNDTISRAKSRQIRDLAQIRGVPLRSDAKSVSEWLTEEGGGMYARSVVGGAVTGLDGLRLAIIDDAFKGPGEANSAAHRGSVKQSVGSNWMSRLHSDTSVIINGTRWHTDDLHGFLAKEAIAGIDWEVINQPAIEESGEPFCPKLLPLKLLERKYAAAERADGPSAAMALYFGKPGSDEKKPFHGVHYFENNPSSYSVAIGIDLNFSESTSADPATIVVMLASGPRRYIVDAHEHLGAPEAFADKLREVTSRWTGAPVCFFASGKDFKQAAQLRAWGIPVKTRLADEDKYTRSLPYQADWRAGRVFVKRGEKWSAKVVTEHNDFTGQDGGRDNLVDAANAAHHELEGAGESLLPIERPVFRRPRPISRRGGAW